MNKVKILMATIYIIVSMSIIWFMDTYSPYRNWALTGTIVLYLVSTMIYNRKQKQKKKINKF